MGGIYRVVGDEIYNFLDFFKFFWSPNGKKRLVFQFKRSNSYSNGQILIQTDQSGAAVSLPSAGPSGRR
jgi:hypothetical protein